MIKQLPLKIHIPNPCSQDWSAMPKSGNAYHCGQCNNVVYDFSMMSDDELLDFFKQRPETHCGRFHISQMDRYILASPKPRKLSFPKFSRIAAAFLTILSFKNISVKAQGQIRASSILDAAFKTPSDVFKTSEGFNDKIIISGTVTDDYGNPLENAKIIFDSIQITATDKRGYFEFEYKQPDLELEDAKSAQHNIYFSSDSMVTQVRSYHAAMLSTAYEVLLYKQSDGTGNGFHRGGVMVNPNLFETLGDLPSLSFKIGSSKLSADSKAILSVIASKMRSNYGTHISVTSYPGVCGRQYIFNQRVGNIRNYLIEKEGISGDRIITNCEVGGGDINIVDIKQTDK